MQILDDQLATNLNYVKVSRRHIDLRYFPNFMIIGPQRTGTTWLCDNLRLHPQIFMSNPKEIHFFNLLKIPNHKKYQSNDLEWYLRYFHDTPVSYSKKMISAMMKYREPYQPLVRGEATPSYAALDRDLIAEIFKIRPDLKIILLVRNPVARAWSHAVKDLVIRPKRKIEDLTDNELWNFFQDEYQVRCGHYSEIIKNWIEYVQEGNLYIDLHDRIVSSPQNFLEGIFSFLGVRKDKKYVTEKARTRINSNDLVGIPDRHRMFLQDLFKDELIILKETYTWSWELR